MEHNDSHYRRLVRRLRYPGFGTAGGTGFMLQDAFAPATRHGHNPNPLYYIGGALAATLAVVLLWGLKELVPWLRRKLATRRRSRDRARAAAMVEERARAMMSELCPHGWRAQITMFGPGDDLPPDAPDGERAQVALDWAELERERRGIAVVRRVWASSIAEALDAMVADRRTDETLEQIEQSAVSDGSLWPDL